jgi:phenylacetate-CoA ligase
MINTLLKPRPKSVESEAQTMALRLFHDMAKRVPAYRDFLSKNNIDPATIQTIKDFQTIPLIDKKNYLTQYPLADLCWDGTLADSRIISVSSGSTGIPFFWPRGKAQDVEGGWMHEQLYRKAFEVDKYSTLVVVCFSMGTWIAGSFTTSSTLEVAGNGLNLNIITPGIERDEAVKVIKALAPNYEQVIICGYPPFLKDVIDHGRIAGIDWGNQRTRLLFAGEAFSEEWRDYVLKLAGIEDPLAGSLNIFGSADAAMLGHETPVSVAVRRIYNKMPKQAQAIFGHPVLPSLAQYYPDRRYFEAVDGELVFSAYSGIPLTRYNIHDTGGVMTYEELTKPLGDKLAKELKKSVVGEAEWNLPFVYLNGRKDFTATIYAVNIYPENIRAALVDPELRTWVTGKFVMETKYYENGDQFLELDIEMAEGVSRSISREKLAQKVVVDTLQDMNAEFKKLRQAIGDKANPVIRLMAFGEGAGFAGGVKHRWVKKDN